MDLNQQKEMKEKTMNDCNELLECLCCGNHIKYEVLNLGDQPLANSYHNGKELPTYPLRLNVCENCFHLQLSHSVNPDLMFKNYLYVSGTSNTIKEYFKWFRDFTLEIKPDATNVLDIACNDGTQLDFYMEKGLDTTGVDPAINLSHETIKKGHRVIVDYFNEGSIKELDKYDIIIAQNVFAHNDHPKDFLMNCERVLKPGGKIFIQTSQANMVKNNEFDTIYHEHISFFSPISMKSLVENCGLHLNSMIKTSIHGTSFVFIISKEEIEYDSVEFHINEFESDGFTELGTYGDYRRNVYLITDQLKSKIEYYKSEGLLVIGYGAAAKGNTLLNFGEIKLDYIIDDNPLKCGLQTPGMNIEIKEPSFIERIKTNKPIVFVPLAWNFYDEIRGKIKNYRDNHEDLFIRYFPKLKISN